MKKKSRILLAAFWVICMIGGCNGSKGLESKELSNAAIGVIETTQSERDSRIIFYDSDLREVAELPLKYATVGEIFSNPVVYDGELYVIPQGYGDALDEEKVLRISLSDLSKAEYRIEQLAMNCVSADERYIYACSTSPGVSYIARCRKEDGKVEEKEEAGIFINNLVAYKDSLYVFGETMSGAEEGEQSYIHIYNSDFQLTDEIDITECGRSQYKALALGDEILFSNRYDARQEANHTISIFSLKDHTIETVALGECYPLDIVEYHGMLLISHFDAVDLAEGGITFYDRASKEEKYFKLGHGAEQMALKGQYLYILSEDNIFKYQVKEMGLELVGQEKIEMKSSKYKYISGIFAL